MRHPPYHLRPNKAIDRVLLVDVLQRLRDATGFIPKSYVGLGGPFLNDFRVVVREYPQAQLYCIEANFETVKRQRFHKLSRRVAFKHMTMRDFITNGLGQCKLPIVWADYTKLSPDKLGDIEALLSCVQAPAVIKVTLPAIGLKHGEALQDDAADLRGKFGRYLIGSFEIEDVVGDGFVRSVYQMIQAATQLAVPPQQSVQFQPIQAVWYADQTPMVSVTGMFCDHDIRRLIDGEIGKWDLANVRWEPLHRIDVPILSVKERLRLEECLPIFRRSAASLTRALGYRLDGSEKTSKEKYEQYRRFHQHYPLFGRIDL